MSEVPWARIAAATLMLAATSVTAGPRADRPEMTSPLATEQLYPEKIFSASNEVAVQVYIHENARALREQATAGDGAEIRRLLSLIGLNPADRPIMADRLLQMSQVALSDKQFAVLASHEYARPAYAASRIYLDPPRVPRVRVSDVEPMPAAEPSIDAAASVGITPMPMPTATMSDPQPLAPSGLPSTAPPPLALEPDDEPAAVFDMPSMYDTAPAGLGGTKPAK